ncbi:DUF4214 domain-containing protein [Herbaspirillum sp. HC18]|nr:DUF4214 domain-containing protein [Herbaspirillum sp. HC18]
MTLTDNQLSLIKLYIASFNRAPEKNGLDYWTKQMAAGQSLSSIVSTIFSLDVVKAIYPDVLPDDAFLAQIYINVFNKLPDSDGLAYWMERLAMGATRSWLAMEMINAGLGVPDGTPGKAFITNRYAAAQYAVNTQLDQNASFNVNTLKSAMATVSDDPATVTSANALINAINTGGLDGPMNPMTVTGATNGYINAAAKAAGISVTVDLTGTNSVAGNTLLFLVNDALFPTSITYNLTAADIKANKATVKFPLTANWGVDGTKILTVKVADVAANHISPAGGSATVVLDVTAPSAPTQPIATSIANQAANGISAAQKAAGVSVVVNLIGTGAAVGDTVQLLLGGSAFSTPVTTVLTNNDITACTATLTIPGASLGTDGVKTLTARITDAAGNAGTAGGTLNINLDTVAPTLSTTSPADNATAVAASGSIVMTFSENVAAGIGNIVISNGAGDTRTIAVDDATQVSFSAKTVTIKPTQPLLPNTGYNVQMAAGVVTDTSGNPYAGISNATILNFTTSALPAYTVAQATTALATDPSAQFTLADTAANLAADAATNSGAGTVTTGRNISFTSAPTIAQLAAVDAATTGTLTYTSVSDTASNLFTNAGGYVKAGTNVTVTDPATIAQLAAIDAANTTGTLTYTAGVTDTAANLLANAGGYVKALANVIVTDAATIAQLTSLDSTNTTGTLTYAAGVTDTAANLRTDALLNAGAGKYVTNHNVTFTTAASIAQLTAVDAATTGTLTYANGVTDTAVNLNADAGTNAGAGTYVTGHDVTFTDAATIAQLTAVDAATTGTLTYAAITDNAANLFANAGGYVKAGTNVTVTDPATIAQLTAIDATNTTGTLTYTAGVTDTAANLSANAGGYVKAGTNVAVTDPATIAQLAAIDAANTTGTLTYTAGVTDTAANLLTNAGGYVKALANVIVTDAATIAQLTSLDSTNTTGTLTYAAGVTDTAANLRTDALLNAGAGKYVTNHNVTFTTAASIAQLTAVDAATTGTLTYANGVTDTAVNLNADAGTNAGAGTYVTGHDVTFTDAATIAQLTAVDAATTGTLTYAAITDNAANLFANAGGYVKAGTNVTVTTVATIAQLVAIDTANTSGTLSYASGIADAYAGYTGTGQVISLINAAPAGTVTFTNSGVETALDVSGLTLGVTIVGNAQDETLIGGSGADKITGGAGQDTMTGSGGADTFKFATGDTTGMTATADSITDLAVGDKIDLTALTNTINGVFVKSAKATVLSGNAVAVGLAGLNDTKYDAYIATVSGNDYLVCETAADGSATQIVLIGATAPGTLANWTFTTNVITVA